MKAVLRVGLLVVIGAGLVMAGDSAADRYSGSEAGESVRLVDSQGVETVATGFGKLFALPSLTAFRGDSEVQIPFARVRRLTTGTVVDNRLPVHVVLTSGRELDVVLDRTEYETIYGGRAEFGFFRIPLENVRTLQFTRAKTRGAGLGQRCGRGHLWYNDTWRFCPVDGTELEPISGDASGDDAPR